jgi:hypothetical protein
MAKKQQKNQYKKPQNKQALKTNKKEDQTDRLKENHRDRPMSQKELMFYRGGMLVILAIIIIVTVVLIVRHIASNELDKNPYDDYIHITEEELAEIVFDRGDGVYGDFTFFESDEAYESLLMLLNTNDVIYLYFYRSSDIKNEITEVLKQITNIEDLAILFIDLDKIANQGVLTNPGLAHLNLSETRNHQLVQFNINEQTFAYDGPVEHIIIELSKLIPTT